MSKDVILKAIDSHKQTVLDAVDYIWKHPEPGYREWNTHAYLKKQYEALGLTVHEFDRIPASICIKSSKNGEDRCFGKIPGFYVDFETGRPGPRLAIFGEMDSLIIPEHAECDKATGAVHACGHHCQSAALLGIAAGLAAPGALDDLSGSIRLIAVPAEELIELEFRHSLKDQGVIRYYGGKQELLYRGLLDDVDLSFMVHQTSGVNFSASKGSDGCILKEFEFVGRSAHAGGAPQKGLNALYAANTALSAANALRETFVEKDYIRFHPIITSGGAAVNAIPCSVKVEAYVRGASVEASAEANDRINRAFAASAAALGCGLVIHDTNGYAPRNNDDNLNAILCEAASEELGSEHVSGKHNWGTGSSDMGDVSAVMPAAHPHIGGAVGAAHGSDYLIADPVLAAFSSARIQASAACRLMENGAALAKKVVAEGRPAFPSIRAFLETADKINFESEAVSYAEDGTVTLKYKK